MAFPHLDTSTLTSIHADSVHPHLSAFYFPTRNIELSTLARQCISLTWHNTDCQTHARSKGQAVWLGDNKDTETEYALKMAFGDETQLDAPVTPAPIFAYRALKSVFWREQETPENVTRTEKVARERDSRGMEKMREFRAQATETSSPSQKRKRIALGQSSPTKSILRTPGALTPRRAMLRDLNVTFKDLRKSVSPELSHKAAMSQRAESADADADANKENMNIPSKQLVASESSKLEVTRTKQSTSSSHLSHINQSMTGKAQTTVQVLPQMSDLDGQRDDKFDSESYMRTTETEMKKLIKYGQKMREYARRQDEENGKLRALLEEAQMENKRLRKQLETSRPEGLTAHQSYTDPQTSQKTTTATTRTDQSKPAIATREPDYSRSNRQSSIQATHRDLFNISNLNETKPHRLLSSSNKRPLPDLFEELSNAHRDRTPPTSSPKKQRRAYTETGTASKAPPPPPPDVQLELPLRPITNGTGVGVGVGAGRLAPDRAAAARARIRKRAELRKESGSGNGRGESSQLDWAGL